MKWLLQLWKKCGFLLLLFFIIAGFYYRGIALLALACMLGPIVSVLLGHKRLWCKNICPRGNFYDNVICKFCNKKPNPKCVGSPILKTIIIVFIFIMFGMGIARYWGNLEEIGGVFYRMIIITTLIGIILAILFNHRTWCCFCPMGSIASFILKRRRKH